MAETPPRRCQGPPGAPPLRAVHLLRPDHATHMGGDLVILRETVAALRDEGVDAVAVDWDDAPAVTDVVHLYNLQLPALLIRDMTRVHVRWPRAKVVVSPVFWTAELGAAWRSGDRQVRWRALKTAGKLAGAWPALRSILARADAVLPNSSSELARLGGYLRLRPSGTWRPVADGLWLDQWPVRRAGQPARRGLLSSFELRADASAVVACAARIEPYKNQLALVRAMELVPDAVLLLVGPEGDRSYARRVRAEGDRRPGRVAILGRRSPAEVRDLLAHTDVHVLASFRETPGLASLEAAATGCEVVVGTNGPPEEYFGDGAHYADPADPVEIAAAVRGALEERRHPALRARVEAFGWSVAGRALAECYKALLGRPVRS